MTESPSTIKRNDLLPWVIPEQCEACADCVNACPVFGLEMWQTDNPDFSIPWLSNPDACIGCGKCEEVCVWGGINMTAHVEEARRRLLVKRPAGLTRQHDNRKFNLREVAAQMKVVILTCLDSRLHVEDILQEHRDNAYILRNAGAAVTECAIRSMMLAIDILEAKQIILIGHRMCGLRVINTKRLKTVVETRVEAEVSQMLGQPFKKWLQLSTDPETNLRKQAEIIRQSKLIPGDIPLTGLMYDEYNGHIYRIFGPETKVSP
ncbi:MAG: 4Fe-4S dicluster domain-containing protein [Nitrospinota bacterium]|nr:4Fe-4S dicluster domain-containing protein [Nitrospinota bacterium]